MTPTKTHQQASKQCKKVYKVPEDVHVETIDEITYVTLEGSDTIVDWFRNICIFKKHDTHRGFLRYANYCIDKYDLVNILRNYPRIVLTGHSLGAAAIVIIAHALKEHPKNVIEIVVFGCPRIGGKAFAHRLNNARDVIPPICSYQYGRDIVCTIPYTFLGFTSTVQPIVIPSLRTYRWFPRIRNHHIDEYISGLHSEDST